MSALPNPPLDDEHIAPEPHRHSSRWKRVVLWTLGGIAVLILLVVAAVVFLLHSSRFHSYALRTAQEKATAALGSEVQAQNFGLRFHGVSPTLDLYNVVIHGSGAHPNPPLLQVDHLVAQVHVSSLINRSYYVNDIVIDHPVVHLYVDKSGNSNIPKPQSSGKKSNTDVFDLGIRHVSLTNGEVYFNDQKIDLNADLHDLDFQSAFDTSHQSYSGSLAYRDGHLKFGSYNPVPHDLHADFTATRQQLTLSHAVLAVGASQVVLDANVTDYSNPKIDATYKASIDAGEFRSILKNPSIPSGIIRTHGTAHYVTDPSRHALDTATVNGDISSPNLTVRTPSVSTSIRNFSAQYSLANGNAEVRNIRAALLGGEVSGLLAMRNLTGNTRSRFQGELRGVSLADVRSMMKSPVLQQVALTGTVNASTDATWGKSMKDLVAKADATLQANLASANRSELSIPLKGVIHANYSAPASQIALAQSYIRTPQTSLNLNGTVSRRSKLAVQLQARDLHELETIAEMFQPPAPGKPSQPFGLEGTALFNGSVSGSTSAPHVVGQFTANNLQVKGSSWRLVRTNVDASPSEARLTNGLLQPASRGQITFAVSAGLNRWSFTPDSPFQATLNGSQINIADLTKAAGVQTSVQGTMNAGISLHGTQLNPIGQGNIKLTRVNVAKQPINNIDLDFRGTGDQVFAKLGVQLPAGVANANVTFFPKQKSYEAQLHADGIRLDQLQTIKERNMQISGVLNVDATGRGTLDNPGVQLTANIPELNMRGQRVSGLKLQTTVANHVANIALDSSVINTQVHGRGTVNLTGDYFADATLDTQVIPLGPLVDVYAPSQAGNVTGQTELHATIKGPLKQKSKLDAHIIVPTLSVDYKKTIQLASVHPIRVDLTNGTLQLQRSEIRGTDTDLQFQGSIPISSTAPASLLLLGTVDLRIAQLYDPTITSSGQLRFNINSFGQTTNPNVQGRIDVVNANLAGGTLPVGLQNGNGVLTLTKDRLDITSFRGTVGSGTVEASGGVVYRPALQFDLALRGRDIRMLVPKGVRTGVDTQLALTGNLQKAELSGQVRVNQLSFTPDFDLMEFVGQFGGATSPPPTQGFTQALQLNVGVQSTNNINLVSRALSVQGSANLNVRGTAADPVILGRVNLSGGDVIFSGNRYVLQGGTVEFANPSRTEPVVNLGINTTIDQYKIAMQFWGPVQQLHTTYTSDPALPPADIINLIAFGKTSEASAANPTPPGALGAESLIASQVSSQLTSRVSKIVGISQLSVDPVLGGGTVSPGARIAIQQRVTSKIFVTFATDVTSTQRQTISLQYQATPRISFSGTRDQNGGFGFDTRIRKAW